MVNFDNQPNREEQTPDSNSLFSKVLLVPDASRVLEQSFGRIVLSAIERGGNVQINSVGSEIGITIELPNEVIKLTPSNSKDPEQNALFETESRAIESGDENDSLKVDVATLRSMLMCDSILKSQDRR